MTNGAVVATTSPRPSRRYKLLFALATWLAVMIVTHRSSADVIGDLLEPDAHEYVTAAQRLATTGHYGIVIDGKVWPSRYPPGWPSLMAPAYWIAPTNLAAGVWIARALWAAGCAAIASAFVGRFGAACSLLIVAVINAEPYTRDTAASPLADAPAAAVMLALLAIRMCGPAETFPRSLGVGTLLALGVACRPFSILFVLPFAVDLLTGPRRPIRAIALIAPVACVAIGTLSYNRATFGSFSMNGYIFWCPMPYARLDYVFHPRYLPLLLEAVYGDEWLPYVFLFGVVASLLLLWRSDERQSGLFRHLLLLMMPITGLHLVYFFFQQRLFLPAIVSCSLAVAVALSSLLRNTQVGRGVAGVVGIALLGVALYGGTTRPAARAAALKHRFYDDMSRSLPARCNVITFISPVLFEALINQGGERRWVAGSRAQEYASKAYATAPIDLSDIPPPPPLEHRSVRLLASGARDAIQETAEDDAMLDRLAAMPPGSTFVDRFTLGWVPNLERRLRARFELTPDPNSQFLIRCTPRPPATQPN